MQQLNLLRLFPSAAPMNFIFKDPDTARIYRSKTKQDLAKQIIAYRSANGLAPIKQLDIVLENYWASLPENAHISEKAPPLKRGFLAYIKGGIALVDNIWYGEKNTVSQEVADTRAKQCCGCKFNIFPDKGPFVAWSDMMAENSVGDKKTKYNDALGNCEVCSCCLRAKVWWKGLISLSEADRVKMKTVSCWQLKSSITTTR